MENKYYTPSIEEFFVGFEFEFRSSFEDSINSSWNKLIYSAFPVEMPEAFYYGLDTLDKNQFRVKYLDSSDIEELGFVKTKYCSVSCYEKDGWRIFWFEDNMVSIEKFYKEEKEQYFRGWVKNKSELIRLLGWLNV